MKISEVVEELAALKREYGDLELVMLYRTDGYVPETVNVPLERGPYGVLIKAEI